MTNHDDPTPAIMRGIDRMLAESRAIDTKKALEGIPIRKLPPRARRHSVFHKSIR